MPRKNSLSRKERSSQLKQRQLSQQVLPKEWEDFLAWLTIERGRALNTQQAYTRDLKRYHAYLCEHELTVMDVERSDVIAFALRLQSQGLARASVVRMLATVKGLHRYCVVEGIRCDDPTSDVDMPSPPTALPKALSVAQVATFIESVDGVDAVARRDRAVLEVLYGTGCRISEVVSMSLADLDMREGLARVIGKGSRERIVPLGRSALSALQFWFAAEEGRALMVPKMWSRKGDSQAVFLNQRGGRLSRQGVWLIVRRYAREVGLEGVLTPHVLRHSCATHMLNGGADIRFVQELLGHASISTTQIYTKVSTEKLWSVYKAAHPRALAG